MKPLFQVFTGSVESTVKKNKKKIVTVYLKKRSGFETLNVWNKIVADAVAIIRTAKKSKYLRHYLIFLTCLNCEECL